jgi:hypothetical protein
MTPADKVIKTFESTDRGTHGIELNDASGKSRRIDMFNSSRYHACTFLYQRFVAELADSDA